ncbi:MAG: response regulator transcription factor [Verrucomicrobia bacterium]|nr:response regulator transcription factor [Verrucomicrobiota bacterium]
MSTRQSRTHRTLLVDDHVILRTALRDLLDRQPDFEVVGEAGDGAEAVRLAKKLQPRLVLMDISLPKSDGVEATRETLNACPKARVIAFTAHESPVVLNHVRRAGAVGYVLKDTSPTNLLAALRRVARGGVHFDPKLLAKAGRTAILDPGHVTDLSTRESQVLRLLGQGYTAKEVAAELEVSTKSVETYKARLMVKLIINNRVELLRYAQVKYQTHRA